MASVTGRGPSQPINASIASQSAGAAMSAKVKARNAEKRPVLSSHGHIEFALPFSVLRGHAYICDAGYVHKAVTALACMGALRDAFTLFPETPVPFRHRLASFLT
jgi:hypothetical protein